MPTGTPPVRPTPPQSAQQANRTIVATPPAGVQIPASPQTGPQRVQTTPRTAQQDTPTSTMFSPATPPPIGPPARVHKSGTRLEATADKGGEWPPPAQIDALVPGMRIHQYELIKELGRGGMGVVFAARDTRLGRRVAMKFLLHASRAIAERFLVEARATAQFNHENIVTIHEVDELEQMPYMVLEFLEGQTLREVLGEHGTRLAPQRAIELILPVARALVVAHDKGIVHRDLKPENVFVTSTGQVKVLDFGIAKALGGREEQSAPADAQRQLLRVSEIHQTHAGALLGTPPYMAPEQLSGEVVDHRADIWALGIMLFEMLTGQHPVQPTTMENLFEMAVGAEPMIAPSLVAGGIDDAMDAVVAACLAKDREQRLPTAAAVVARLEQLLPGRRGRQLGEGESPFPGLHAFQEQDANRFFGRDRDVARTVARLREHPLLGIIGPSGVGKSSFIRAGVGPMLKASGESWEVVTLRPGRHPLAALASVLHKMTSTSSGSSADVHAATVATLRTAPGAMGELLRVRARDRQTNILLFIDQFEELYTLAPDAAERKAFTAALCGVADDAASPLRVVVSMRSDFLDRTAEDPRFVEDLSRGLIFLAPPDRTGLREALVQPIEMVGHTFESHAMVEDMLDGLGDTAGALPLLQFAAAKLWDVRDKQRKMLTMASYHAIGGITGALAAHADEVVSHMDQPTRRLTQRIFRQLVTQERTRAVVEMDDLAQLANDRSAVTRVIDQLVAARLLTVQAREGGASVEIVHESLITSWPTLRAWLDEEQEDAAFVAQLATAAKQWDAKGRPGGLLWRGDAADEARRWYAARQRELGQRELAFIEAVFSLMKRGARMRRLGLIAAFTVLAAVAGGAFVAFLQVRGAQAETAAQAQKAQQEADKATEALAEAREQEKQRDAAERQKTKAEAEAADKKAALAGAQVDLATANAKLQQQVDEITKSKADAEAAAATARDAQKKAEDAQKKAIDANANLKKVTDAQAAEIKRLQDTAGVHATTLKK
jgi:serine/threonine protein kinase